MNPRCTQNRSKVQMALWGGLTPDNANDSRELDRMLNSGAVGFKAFMCPSGINDFPHVSRYACSSLSCVRLLAVRRGDSIYV